ncbi:hypothetical protein D3C81_750330 [compost metagenome]
MCLFFGADAAVKADQIAVLLGEDVENGAHRRGQQHQAGQLAAAGLGDATSQHPALAVAEHVEMFGIDAGRRGECGDGGYCVVGGFIVDAESTAEILRTCVRAFFVAQHRNTLRGEAACDIQERTIRADGFIAVLRAGAMHQHHRRERPIALGQGQRAGQAVLSFRADRHEERLFDEARIRRRRSCLRRRGRLHQEAGDLVVLVEHDARLQPTLRVFQWNDDDAKALGLAGLRIAALAGGAHLRGQGFPHGLEFVGRHGGFHLCREHRFSCAVLRGI